MKQETGGQGFTYCFLNEACRSQIAWETIAAPALFYFEKVLH
jgi:hypothetical protein